MDYMLLVKPGEALPQLNKTISISNYFNKGTVSIKVMKITSLRWNTAGSLIVEFKDKEVRMDG